jgi:hypothetical protein
LASLGRADELEGLYREAGARVLDAGALSVMWRHSMEALALMRTQPGQSYRCGVLALYHVTVARGGVAVPELVSAESPETGFSLDQLQSLAFKHSLGLRAAKRERQRTCRPKCCPLEGESLCGHHQRL